MKETITLYPSEKNSQRTDATSVPLQWAIAYLQDLFRQVPTEDQDKARTTWPLTVTYEHKLSDVEEMEYRRKQTIAWVRNLPADEATAADLAQLRSILGL